MGTEERLAEIRGRCAAVEHASPITDLNPALDALWKFRHDIPYLLAEIDRLTAEVAKLAPDAVLGVLVRRMPELLAHLYDDDGGGEEERFRPQWASLMVDETGNPPRFRWGVQVGYEEMLCWSDVDRDTPELALEHALRIAATKEDKDVTVS